MNLPKRLKIPLYSFFKIRTPLYITTKKIRIFLAKRRLKKQLVESKEKNELLQLFSDGFVLSNNLIDLATINSWITRYNISNENFIECEGNLSFPFYNKEFHDIMFNSKFLEYLNSYYELVYGKKAVLQSMPSLVITKPMMDQIDFTSSEHNFPAVWHTDYITEFTIHIPLFNIDDSTNHTKYLVKSHTNYFIPPIGALKVDETKKVDCFANVGDALFIDVDGWHRGHLEKGSFRAMIQLKYTVGNDRLFFDPNNTKQKAAIIRLKKHIRDYPLLKSVLEEDYLYFKSKSPNFNAAHINQSLELAYKSL